MVMLTNNKLINDITQISGYYSINKQELNNIQNEFKQINQDELLQQKKDGKIRYYVLLDGGTYPAEPITKFISFNKFFKANLVFYYKKNEPLIITLNEQTIDLEKQVISYLIAPRINSNNYEELKAVEEKC